MADRDWSVFLNERLSGPWTADRAGAALMPEHLRQVVRAPAACAVSRCVLQRGTLRPSFEFPTAQKEQRQAGAGLQIRARRQGGCADCAPPVTVRRHACQASPCCCPDSTLARRARACRVQAGKWFTMASPIKLRLLLAIAAARRYVSVPRSTRARAPLPATRRSDSWGSRVRRQDAPAANRQELDAAFQELLSKISDDDDAWVVVIGAFRCTNDEYNEHTHRCIHTHTFTVIGALRSTDDE